MKELVRAHAETAIAFWRRYEHHLGVGALTVGFVFDLFLAKSPESVIDNILLVSYLFIAAAIIILLNVRRRRALSDHAAEPLILLLILQFCFGGLASNLLVLYGKSGTFTASAIFVGLLGTLVFGNEYLRSRYSQLRLNIAIYYFLLLTYSIIAAPTFIFHAIGGWVFLASGLLSLAVMAGFLAVLFFVVFRGDRRQQLEEVSLIILIIFSIFSGLYFLNIIPPVPLSLKDSGIYHSILKRSSGDYLALYEPPLWYMFWRDTSPTFVYEPGTNAYCFSSVYAPSALDTPIFHRWEHYNTESKSWDTVSRISFAISGGRAAGYRGFSIIGSLSPGEWRCDVETGSGALIGRISFTAVPASTTPLLSTTTL